jgi:hypothetical protein
MCGHYTITIDRSTIEYRFGARFYEAHAEFQPTYRRDDADMLVFCFAEREHAEQFRDRLGGEFIRPKDRPKWPRSKT